MLIREPRPGDTFALIRRAALADGTLSFKARGILAYLLSLPPGDTTTSDKLSKHGTDGERAVKSGIKELEDHGYLIRDGDGVDLRISDVPGIVEPVQDELPVPVERVGTPTPQQVAPRGWQPSPEALKTAHDSIELLDIPLSITHYRIRAAELHRAPSSAEWLRWLVKDEEKARLEERRLARENGEKKSWWATA